jgi:hypothetical protein
MLQGHLETIDQGDGPISLSGAGSHAGGSQHQPQHEHDASMIGAHSGLSLIQLLTFVNQRDPG